MKKIFLVLLLLCSNVFAQDMYNSIATAYVTTTISQNIVFDNTLRQGGTFTFSVLAHNGGGRAGQSDTANVRIQFYNSSGGLMGTFQSSYNANLPNPNAVCGNPCIDPAVPWTTLTVSTTVDAASAANIAYAKISMYGIDGSYWAGDYGPWYRAPTFQLNGGSNLAYNPEFGPYNGITAQGWTSSPGFGACQGAWGGSNACIVNSSGTPGTSTTGLVANQNGGGPDPNGGTTSGTAGGYNSTMTTSSPSGAPATGPTATGTTRTNRVTTSTTYGTPVTTVSYQTRTVNTLDAQGHQVTHTYTDTVYTTTTPVYTTTTTTEVTTTTWSDGTTTSVDGATTTTTTTTYQTGQPTIDYATTPTSTEPWICCGGSAAPFSANPVNVAKVVDFANRTTADSKIYIEQVGNQNNITIDQSGTKNNYASYVGNGSSNDISITQSSTSPTAINYTDLHVVGNSNTVAITQQSTGGTKGAFVTVQDNNNSVTLQQKDSGNHYAEISVAGGNKNVDVLQQGSASHMARIGLTGNPVDLTLIQGGSTQQFYSIQFNCATAGGCTPISVKQGN